MGFENNLYRTIETHVFSGKSYELPDTDVILSSITLFENAPSHGCAANKDAIGFSIVGTKDNKFTIIPNSACETFLIIYNRAVPCKIMTIDKDEIGHYKDKNNNYSFYIDEKNNLLN